MSEQQKRVYDAIIDLPEEVCNRILEYIEAIKFNMLINNAPKELIPQNEEELNIMLEEADKDIENGDVYLFDDIIAEIDNMLVEWGGCNCTNTQ